MRALERERARRWPSAQELERSLAEVVLGGARSLEDTDVGAFVRRMFPEEAGVAEPLPGTGSIPISLSTSAPPAAGPREASPSVPVTPPQPTELVTPPPAEPGPTEILPRAAPLRRRVAGVLALAALAAAATLAVRAGPGLLTRERERPGTPPARETLGAEQPAASPVRPPPASGSALPPSRGEPTAAAPPAPAPGTSTAVDPGAGAPGKAGQGAVRARLVIRAKPWAALRVDGKRAGYVQGSKTVRLPAGRHLVELTGPDGVSGAYTVQLVQGRTATLEHPPAER